MNFLYDIIKSGRGKMFEVQNNEQIVSIYNEYMTSDFPEDELKPLAQILSMVNEGTCTFYALRQNEEVLSYFSVCQKGQGLLVDYLAVNKKYRGQGIGTRTLDFLKSISDNKYIIIECEDEEKAEDESNKITRLRRIAFYERAGFKRSGVSSNLFGVDYIILTHPNNISKHKVKELYSAVYLKMLGQSMYDKFMKI